MSNDFQGMLTMTIKVGDRIPSVTLQHMTADGVKDVSRTMVRKISIVLCMPAKVSGGERNFQSFRGGWNKWEAQATPKPPDQRGKPATA